MLEGSLLRVLTFEPGGLEATVDPALRDAIVPALAAPPACRHVFAGRRGGPGTSSRLLASVWAAGPAEADEVRLLVDRLPRLAATLRSAHLDVLPLEISASFERPEEARIIRLFRGRVLEGEMDAYLDEARAGMEADALVNEGLVGFHLASRRPAAFVAVSAWSSWPAIEEATGGDVRRPFMTRDSKRLAGFEVVHFELLAAWSRGGPGGPPSAAA